MGFRLERPASPHPAPNSQLGAALRDEFIAAVYKICGDVRLLWLPKNTDGATATDASRYAATVTYDAAKTTADYTRRGSAWSMTFDGAADEGDVPDNDRYTFGDGVADQPFSVFAWVEADDATPAADATIISKWNEDTDGEQREWRVLLTITNGYPRIEIYDESANTYIGREDQTALTADTWTFLAFTYDGSASNVGINVYLNGAATDDANAASGTYVAMENLTSKLLLAHNLSAAATPVAEGFWDGGMVCVAVVAKELSIDDVWALKAAGNKYFDLTL